jgi:hypothetical protein
LIAGTLQALRFHIFIPTFRTTHACHPDPQAAVFRSLRRRDLLLTSVFRLKDGLDFGVEGDVCGGETVDGKFLAGGFGKLEEAADVIVLVVSGKDLFGFVGRKAESGKSYGLAKFTGVQEVETNEFAQRHDGSAASAFGADDILLRPSVLPPGKEKKNLTRIIPEADTPNSPTRASVILSEAKHLK